MICPACKNPMIVLEYKGIELDICASCNGIWFDADELRLLLEKISLKISEVGQSVESAEEKRKCPICRRKMGKVAFHSAAKTTVDSCGRGHGLWFDGGEIDSVIAGLRAEIGTSESKVVTSFLAELFSADTAGKDEK